MPGLLGVGVDEGSGRIFIDDVGMSWGRMSMLLLLSVPAPPLPLSWPLREPPLRLFVGEAALGTLLDGMLVAATLATGLAIPGGRFLKTSFSFSMESVYMYFWVYIRWELWWWCGKASLE